MLKQNLAQKQMQKLSPQQIQLMRLLQIPAATLEQRIKEELEANPALDEGPEKEDEFSADAQADEDAKEEDYELDDYLREYMEDDPASYNLRQNGQTTEEEEKAIPIAVRETFHEFLEKQLGLLKFPGKREKAIAEYIIGNIGDDGYLHRSPQAIVDDLLFAQNIQATEEEVEYWLQQIQRFEPPGIGARNLRECLAIQLRHKLEREDLPDERRKKLETALKIVEKAFDNFSNKRFNQVKTRLQLSDQELKDAMEEILQLNPKPASAFSAGGSQPTEYVVPDFFVLNRDGNLELMLNNLNMPDLRINSHYQNMLREYHNRARKKQTNKKDKEAIMFIKQKIDNARWFIDAIRQRYDTMQRIMQAIIQYQKNYFLSGDEMQLRPMILKDIADITGLDISTVSRVANSKYVQTEFGTKKLKDFFSEGMTTTEGEEVSTREIKNALKELIENEDKRKPLSDEKLMKLLRQKGYDIARRTVAKYREQMNIPVARLRKEL
ncbi:MAG TPA: RNA polymerase sigma-54 factor [Phaeodactylibacter sp.]|nr:RNA polymerase sigma-54 factor [Phaeodactylibacter sp.]